MIGGPFSYVYNYRFFQYNKSEHMKIAVYGKIFNTRRKRWMLTYDLDKRNGRALYEYLYQCIKEDILNGRLITGEKLPSKRALARHLQVSVITVENAYGQLIVEGYIQPVEKKGYFVRPVEGNVKKGGRGKEQAYLHEIVKPHQKPDWFLDFTANGVNPEYFPFSVWSRLMRKVLTEQEKGLLEKVDCQGEPKLRKAIADYLYHFRGMDVAPEQIVVGAGAEHLYGLLIQLLGFQKIYALEDPGYRKIGQIYKRYGVDCRYVNLDSDGLSVEGLSQSRPDVVHICPSHHYPTGIVMPIKRRQEILKWAGGEKGRYIIEDDYDSEFRFTGRPIESLEGIDHWGKVIYMNTFSKTIAPSIRVGYMVLPPHLMEKYQREMGFYACAVPSFEQHTLATFISQGYFEQHLNRMRNYYRSKRDQVVEALKKNPAFAGSVIREADAGLHFLLEVQTRKEDPKLVEECRKRGLKIACLSQFYQNPHAGRKHTLLINYSGLDCSRLEQGLELLQSVL